MVWSTLQWLTINNSGSARAERNCACLCLTASEMDSEPLKLTVEASLWPSRSPENLNRLCRSQSQSCTQSGLFSAGNYNDDDDDDDGGDGGGSGDGSGDDDDDNNNIIINHHRGSATTTIDIIIGGSGGGSGGGSSSSCSLASARAVVI